jgi:hypothetical protein
MMAPASSPSDSARSYSRLTGVPDTPVSQANAATNRIHLVQDFSVFVGSVNREVTVPSDFASDGASIPRLLWPIFGTPFEPRMAAASVVHDYMYSPAGSDTRAEADRTFRELLMRSGMSSTMAYVMWFGVRVFGGSSFRGRP